MTLFKPATGPYAPVPPDIVPDWYDRFFGSIYRFSNNPMRGCWYWTGPFDGCGYGMISVNRKPENDRPRLAARRAHIFSFEKFICEIFGGLVVCHACDCPQCVNPLHLFLGTIQDNMNDRNRKGRQARGDTHARAILTTAQVLQIRASNEHPSVLAARFGVSQSAIYTIKSRRSWRHI